MTRDPNPELEPRRGDHTDAMLRYEELLIEIARGEYSFEADKYGRNEGYDAIRQIIVNCSECDGKGYTWDLDGEEDNCFECKGEFHNIIEDYKR